MHWTQPSRDITLRRMEDQFVITCPYCGETVEIYLEPDVEGNFVQDCEVCCNPWAISVRNDGEEREIKIARTDGGE
ncbi:CPXCG motif-containing cysteine-rich protein [Methyloterricola oryzae]|uniref:CPXCG motif-containing cysteine-rich protein n=1 Tax=Methyloterricola oryzae TaxID=1495050 RepID=UPI0034DD1BAE